MMFGQRMAANQIRLMQLQVRRLRLFVFRAFHNLPVHVLTFGTVLSVLVTFDYCYPYFNRSILRNVRRAKHVLQEDLK